jgi:arginyl-tRNA synthetase
MGSCFLRIKQICLYNTHYILNDVLTGTHFVNSHRLIKFPAMSLSYQNQARRALDQMMAALSFKNTAEKAAFETDLVLRPPRNESWGDLSTNAIILLKSNKYISYEDAEIYILDGFQRLGGLEKVNLAANGYVNLVFTADFWRQNLVLLLQEAEKYGLEPLKAAESRITLTTPAEIHDLLSAREQANSEVLARLAGLAGWSVDKTQSDPRGAQGIAFEAAVAKCTADGARFALLANSPAFALAFSHNLAIDKTYNNPVFSIPYAASVLDRLIAGHEDEREGAADISALCLPLELNLAKKLCGWPLAVTRSLEKGDVEHLVSFLQSVSLLFFRLADQERPVSSSYLQEPETKAARITLLKAVKTILTGGLDVLGVSMNKEFE